MASSSCTEAAEIWTGRPADRLTAGRRVPSGLQRCTGVYRRRSVVAAAAAPALLIGT